MNPVPENSTGTKQSFWTFNRALAGVVVVYALSTALYYLAGVRFDSLPLQDFVQVLDPELLRTRLAESLLYLHAQPPAFNLYLGIILKVFAGNLNLAFYISYLLLGLVTAIALFVLLVRLRFSPRTSAILTLLLAISPGWVLYEHQLFYDFPVMSGMVFAALFLQLYASTGKAGYNFLFFLMLALEVLTRSLFHPVLLVAILVMMLIAIPNRRKIIILSALVPLLLAFSLYVKNEIVFGGFYGSSWLGANIENPTTQMLPIEERKRLVSEGKLTPIVLQGNPFAPLDTFRQMGIAVPISKSGIPALDQEIKSTGYANNNNAAYITLSNEYLKNALYIIRTRPFFYSTEVAKAMVLFMTPESSVWSVDSNRRQIATADMLYNHIVFGQILYPDHEIERNDHGTAAATLRHFLNAGLFVLFGYPLLILWGTRKMWRAWRTKSIDPEEFLLLALMCGTMLFVLVVGNLFSVAENSRYRMSVDSYVLTLAALFFRQKWPKIKKGFRRTP